MATDYFAPLREIQGQGNRQSLSMQLNALETQAQDKRASRRAMMEVLGDPRFTKESRETVSRTGNLSALQSIEDRQLEEDARNWQQTFGGGLEAVTPEKIQEVYPRLTPKNQERAKTQYEFLTKPILEKQKADKDARDFAERQRVNNERLAIDRQREARLAAVGNKVKNLAESEDYINSKIELDAMIEELENPPYDEMAEEEPTIDKAEIARLKEMSIGLNDLANGKMTGKAKWTLGQIGVVRDTDAGNAPEVQTGAVQEAAPATQPQVKPKPQIALPDSINPDSVDMDFLQQLQGMTDEEFRALYGT